MAAVVVVPVRAWLSSITVGRECKLKIEYSTISARR